MSEARQTRTGQEEVSPQKEEEGQEKGVNPIVNFSEDLVKRGMKKLERKFPDVDKFFADLEEMCSVEDGRLVVNGDIEALYERHPDIRIGIRRAMFTVEKKLRKDSKISKQSTKGEVDKP